MPSVLGLLGAREKKIREAEHALQRLVDARATVAEVLAGPPSAVADPVRSAVTGSLVPHRADGMTASVLSPDYQRIVAVLQSEAGREGMRCQQLAAALGLEAVPAKVEGVRSKAKRLVERGWALQVRPGVFTALAASDG
ncbi:hypothetical protein [Streptomyces cavernae]|uniref:hypothetical protein n=1 Tax=Streptomyces cavernae TaxID=2259034 RepID=UPI000FEBDFA0|nr:hypothetical protein [Streptomyces cavernae]